MCSNPSRLPFMKVSISRFSAPTAGKSSFIKAVNREYYPQPHDDVVFRIRGEEVWDVFAMRSFIGIVSNDLQYTYTREVSGRDVILSGFFSSIGLFNHTVTPAMEERTDEILKFLEIGHLQASPDDRDVIR